MRSRGLDRFGEPLAGLGFHNDAVDDGFDVVFLVATEVERVLGFILDRLAEVDDGAVDAGADEALLDHRIDDFLVEALLAPDDGR